MKNATMVYRPNGGELLHGHMVDWQIVDADDVPEALDAGWFLTPTEAAGSLLAPAAQPEPVDIPADDVPATRTELETKARELGLKFDGRTTDKKLGEQIAAKLKA